jgi:ATP-dependent helicase/nuclease subunit B
MAVVWTRYGPSAYAALRDLVTAVKRDDPLAAVTLLVPSQICGTAARRVLARGVGTRPGIAGLSVLTLGRLAERVATPALVAEGRRPATTAVLAAAWRRILAADPGLFGPVAAHPATVRALMDAHRQVRELDPPALAVLTGCGEPITGELVRLHRAVTELLEARWYDGADLYRRAARLATGSLIASHGFGTIVLFLPQDLSPAQARLVARLGDTGALQIIAGVTGEPAADDGVTRCVTGLAVGVPPPPAGSAAVAATVVHASDSDDEVRCVVRMLVRRLAAVPAHRVAVLYGSAEPYARLLSEHLTSAGITVNGVGVRPTVERTLARSFLDLLDLPRHGWRRDAVMGVLAAAPIRDGEGRRVPASRWERISRTAGVVDGTDWDVRLKLYAESERAAAAVENASQAPRPGLVTRRAREADAAEQLQAFVAGLRTRLATGTTLTSWPEVAGWADGLYRSLLGDVQAHEDDHRVPPEEAAAAAKVERVLAGLADLGAVEPLADLAALRTTLDLELAEDPPRQGRFGTGVLVAPLSAATGLDADLVFVVGAAEDLLPGRISEDPLLPERVRALTAGGLPSSAERLTRIHRHLLAALDAAAEVVISFPRGDLRRSAARMPSRWLLPSLRALCGDPTIDATSWDRARGPWLVGSPSFAASLSGTTESGATESGATEPATEQEWRVRALLTSTGAASGADAGAGRGPAGPLDRVLDAARAMLAGRAATVLTRFDGDLTGCDVVDPTGEAVVHSPTALEVWAACPHAYLVGRLLRVEPVEVPEDLIKISPLEVGSLVHETLDRFFATQAAAGTVPAAATRWSPEQRTALTATASEVADEFTVRGVTGHRLLWQQERIRILADLLTLLDDDEQVRANTGRRQERSELTFGMRGHAPADVKLLDGRTVRFRGSADRVDTAGDTVVVVDYKTGSARRFKTLSESNPTANGSKLQLPVYALAARAALGRPDAPVAAEYWFLRGSDRGRIQVPLTEGVFASFAEAVRVIIDGITSGLFPHRPPTEDGWAGFIECRYCDPDGLGVSEHRTRWAAKQRDPRLARYTDLVQPDD